VQNQAAFFRFILDVDSTVGDEIPAATILNSCYSAQLVQFVHWVNEARGSHMWVSYASGADAYKPWLFRAPVLRTTL